MEKAFCVYIMTNKEYGTLYIGVTSNLPKRIYEHKHHLAPGFTDRYNLDKLAYYEQHENAESAIRREKRLKCWARQWKIELIEKMNPTWRDLYDDICAFA